MYSVDRRIRVTKRARSDAVIPNKRVGSGGCNRPYELEAPAVHAGVFFRPRSQPEAGAANLPVKTRGDRRGSRANGGMLTPAALSLYSSARRRLDGQSTG